MTWQSIHLTTASAERHWPITSSGSECAGRRDVRRQVPPGVVIECREPEDACLARGITADHRLAVVVRAKSVFHDGVPYDVPDASLQPDRTPLVMEGMCQIGHRRVGNGPRG